MNSPKIIIISSPSGAGKTTICKFLVKKMNNLELSVSYTTRNKRSNEIISYIAKKSNKAFPIIGVGGIMSPEDALEKIKSGADLIQLYTGFIYNGPDLIKQINKLLLK